MTKTLKLKTTTTNVVHAARELTSGETLLVCSRRSVPHGHSSYVVVDDSTQITCKRCAAYIEREQQSVVEQSDEQSEDERYAAQLSSVELTADIERVSELLRTVSRGSSQKALASTQRRLAALQAEHARRETTTRESTAMKGRLVRVDDELWDDFKRVAAERGDVPSELLRAAMRRYVKRHDA